MNNNPQYWKVDTEGCFFLGSKPSDFIAQFIHHGNWQLNDERITQTKQTLFSVERDVVKHDTPLKEHLHHAIWAIPSAKYTKLYGFDQSMVWYPTEPEAEQYLSRLVKNIKSYHDENWLDKYPDV